MTNTRTGLATREILALFVGTPCTHVHVNVCELKVANRGSNSSGRELSQLSAASSLSTKSWLVAKDGTVSRVLRWRLKKLSFNIELIFFIVPSLKFYNLLLRR